MYSHPSQEEGIAPRVCTPQADARPASIDFYPSSAYDEAPLTGRALRDVLEAGSRAASAVIAGGRGRQEPGRLSLRDANPMLLALLRASPAGPDYAEREGLPLSAQDVDPFAGLAGEDTGPIGPVFQAALRPDADRAPAWSDTSPPPRAGDDGLSEEVMHYLRTLETQVASTMSDTGAVTTDDALAHEASEANGRLAKSLIDGWLSDTERAVAAADASGSPVPSGLLQQNPMLLGMLEAPTVTASAYDAYRLPTTGDASFAWATPPLHSDWRRNGRAYAVMTETISEASTPTSPIAAVGASRGKSPIQPPALTVVQVQERVGHTAHLLRVLGAVVRRDIVLPKNTSTPCGAVAQYDARFVLCAAYRAIILNVPGKHAWLPLQRFTNALDLDLSTFSRWTARYRLEDGPPNAFWETLAPHTWIDAFAVIDALEAGRRGAVPTADDLAATALYGRLQLERGKRLGVRLQDRVNEWLAGTETGDAQQSGSGARMGEPHVPAPGTAVPAATGSSRAVDGIAARVAATVSTPSGTAVTLPIFDPLRRTAWRVRLLAAAASGVIMLERTAAPVATPMRRYDPRHVLIAAYEALADQLRVGGNTLRLRTLAMILGLVPRTVYAWRTSYVRNRSPGAAYGRRVVAGSGMDHAAFIAAMKAVMREPAPVLADLRATSLHGRLLGLFESTLNKGTREQRRARANRSGVPSGTSVPSAPSGAGDVVQAVARATFHAAAPPTASVACAARASAARRCSF